MSVSFTHPVALLLLALIPAYWLWLRRRRPPALVFSCAAPAGHLTGRLARSLARLPEWLRALGFASLVVALAAPRTGAAVVNVDAEGIAIVVVLDISSSMLAEDFSPDNRLHVAKEKVAEFIAGRRYDRVGLVAFAGEALTQVPLTLDYPVIYQALDQLQAGTGQLEDGTAIGTAVATAANRLRRVAGKSHVMILMTDGENNRGEIDPLTAARAAAVYQIRIYTIGVGSEGVAPIPVATGPFGVQYANLPVHLDEPLLRQMAQVSGGRYFRATNEQALDSIYRQIDRLERSTVQVRRYVNYTARYLPFILLGACALLAEWLLRASRFGRLP